MALVASRPGRWRGGGWGRNGRALGDVALGILAGIGVSGRSKRERREGDQDQRRAHVGRPFAARIIATQRASKSCAPFD